MTGQSNQKRRHTRLDIELKAVLGYGRGVECSVLTDNLSFSGARFSLMVPVPPTLPGFAQTIAPDDDAERDSVPLPNGATSEPPVLADGAVVLPSSAPPLTARDEETPSPTQGTEAQWVQTQELEVSDAATMVDALAEQVEAGEAQAEASEAALVEAETAMGEGLGQTQEVEAHAFEAEPSTVDLEPVGVNEQAETHRSDVSDSAPDHTDGTDQGLAQTREVEAHAFEAESPAANLDPVSEIDGPEPESPEDAPVLEVPMVKVTLPEDSLEWVDLFLPEAEEPIRLSVREIRRIDEAVMVEFVDSTFTEYTIYKNFLIQRGLESGSDLSGEFDANPHLAQNFELEFNNRKLGQILEILYGLTSREVHSAIKEQQQSGRRLGDILIGWGRITRQQLQAAIAVSKSGQDTLFSQFFLKVLPTKIWERFWQLFGEGATMVLVTLGVMVGLGGIPQGGLISIFLVATALNSRIESILQVQDGKRRGRELLGLFLGLFVGYAAVSILFNSTMIYRMFEVLLNSNGVTDTETLFDRKFHSVLPIMANNLMVLISGCILSFCFRQYGVLLTLVWNACLWGVSLVTLVTQTLDRIHSDMALKVLTSTLSLMPHLAIEALGYIHAASAAHGISKAVMWGAGARAQQRRAITKYLVQIIIGAILITLGACLESYWVPWSMRTIMLGLGNG